MSLSTPGRVDYGLSDDTGAQVLPGRSALARPAFGHDGAGKGAAVVVPTGKRLGSSPWGAATSGEVLGRPVGGNDSGMLR